MESISNPTTVQSSFLGTEGNEHLTNAPDGDPRLGAYGVQKLDDLAGPESRLQGIKDASHVGRSFMRQCTDGTKDTIKKLSGFGITQALINIVSFAHSRLNNLPEISRMKLLHEDQLNKLAKGNLADFVSFDISRYIESIDKHTLGSLDIPDNLSTEFSQILLDFLNSKDEYQLNTAIRNFLDKNENHHFLQAVPNRLSPEQLDNLKSGKIILTPKTLLVKSLSTYTENPVDSSIESISQYCQYICEHYEKQMAMTLYARSLASLKIETAVKGEKTTMTANIRHALNVSADLLMKWVPIIYVFLIANLIADRSGSGPARTGDFANYLARNHSSIQGQERDQLLAYADNLFGTNEVDSVQKKLGNLLPSLLAISTYLISTSRLGFNLLFPENKQTYVNRGLSALLESYQKALDGKKECEDRLILEDGSETSIASIIEALPSDNRNITHDDDSAPPAYSEIENETLLASTSKTGVPVPGSAPQMNTTVFIRNLLSALEGDRQTKIDKALDYFSKSLIIARSGYNVGLEAKDSTPDTPARNKIFFNVVSPLVIPLSSIENRGVVDNMAAEKEKSRIRECLMKAMNNEPLTEKDQDFIQGIIEEASSDRWSTNSTYLRAKNTQGLLTKLLIVWHISFLFTDIASRFSSIDEQTGRGISFFSPIMNANIGDWDVRSLYKMFYRPALEVINLLGYKSQHGLTESDKYNTFAMLNVIGRSLTTAPALILWDLNKTVTDTVATLVDSLGTTGHDQDTHANLAKGQLAGNIEVAQNLMKLSRNNPNLWQDTFHKPLKLWESACSKSDGKTTSSVKATACSLGPGSEKSLVQHRQPSPDLFATTLSDNMKQVENDLHTHQYVLDQLTPNPV